MSAQTRSPQGLTYECLSPAPDGTRVRFLTSQRYRLGSVVVWINGLRLAGGDVAAQDGMHVDLVLPPRSGDTLEVQYTAA